jgi:hypothetical protein
MCSVCRCFFGQAKQKLLGMLNLEIRFVVTNRTPAEQAQAGSVVFGNRSTSKHITHPYVSKGMPGQGMGFQEWHTLPR